VDAGMAGSVVKKRVLFGALMILVVIGLFALDYCLEVFYFYYLLCAFLVGYGIYEFYGIAEARGIRPHKYLGVFCAVMLALSSKELIAVFFPRVTPQVVAGMAQLGILMAISILVLGVFVQQILKRGSGDAFADISATFFGMIYVGFLGSFFVKIRHLYRSDNHLIPNDNYHLAGLLFVLLVLIGTKGSDMMAFFTGRKWGRRPLIPHISPKKSWEGAIAGLAFGTLVGLVWALAFGDILRFRVYSGIILGFVLAFAGLAGDLAESLIKRKASVKDSGKWIPEFGGLLDVIDAPLFGAPAVYYAWLLINQLTNGYMRPLIPG